MMVKMSNSISGKWFDKSRQHSDTILACLFNIITPFTTFPKTHFLLWVQIVIKYAPAWE